MICVKERRHRQPDLGAVWKLEVRRHDPDHRVRLAVHGDHTANHRGICVIEAPPRRVAEEHDARRSRCVFVSPKQSSQLRLNAEEREQVSSNELTVQPRRLRAFRDGDASSRVRGDPREGPRLIAPVQVIQVRDAVPVSILRVEVPQRHEVIRVGERKWPEDDRIERGEEGGIGRDPNGEAHDGDDRERGTLTQRTGGVAHVLEEGFHSVVPEGGWEGNAAGTVRPVEDFGFRGKICALEALTSRHEFAPHSTPPLTVIVIGGR